MNSSLLDQIFGRMNGLKVLVIGDVMADAYIRGKVDRISPEAPVPILNTRHREVRLGGAANVALNLKALGADVTLCALVGNDDTGILIKNLVAEAGMHTHGLVVSPNRPTTIKTRIIAGSQHLLRLDEENDSPTFENEKQEILRLALQLAETADAIIFEDYDKGLIFRELIEKTVEVARKRDIPVTVDPKKRNFLDYQGVTLFKPNLKELKEGLKTDFNPRNNEEVELASRQMLEAIGAGFVLLTLSEHGMAITGPAVFRHTPAMPRDIADVSGAGDTVISVATMCLALGCSEEMVLTLSNLAGGLVCESSGVVPINKAQLLDEARRLSYVQD